MAHIPSTSQTLAWLRHQFFGGDEHGTLAGWLDAGVTAADLVSSQDVTTIVTLTQAEYDALSPPDDDTLYVILEEPA